MKHILRTARLSTALTTGLLSTVLMAGALAVPATAPRAEDPAPAATPANGAPTDGAVVTGPVAERAASVAGELLAQVEQQISPQPSAEEATRNAPVEKALAEGAGEGAFAALRGRQAAYVTRQDVALRALRHNLSIASSGLDPAKAAEAVREAEAVFDPVLALGVSYSQSETRARSRLGNVRRKAFGPVGRLLPTRPLDPNEPGISSPDAPIPPGSTSPSVRQLLFRHVIGANPVQTQIVASADDTKGPAKSASYTVDLQQQLPWGVSLSLGAATSQRWIYSENDHPYYDRMFAGSLSAALAGPVPFAAGWGEFAPAEVNIKLNQIAAKRTDWATRETVNQILRAVDTAYWRLVSSLEVLQAAQANLDASIGLAERAQRLYDLQRATAMDKTQADAVVARARVQLEDARSAYLEASNTLGSLLSDKPDGVVREAFLPYGYGEDFKTDTWPKVSEADALAKAKANRPLLSVAQADIESADFAAQAADRNTRPNVDFNLSVKTSQDNSKLGYKNPVIAYEHMGRPDNVAVNGGVSWSQGWGNRGPEAASASAQLGARDARLASRQSENAVHRQVGEAIAALAGARARVKQSRVEVERMEAALASLNRRVEIGGDVTRYEILDTTRRLYTARQGLITALTDLKIAESNLEAAQGTLATDYAQVTAAGEMERKRIAALQSSGLLAYFSLPKLGGDEAKANTN